MTHKPQQADKGLTIDAQTLDPSQENCAPVKKGERQLLTDDGRLTRGRLKGLSMNKAIWVLAWPILLESYLNSLVGLTDTMLASQISGKQRLAVANAAVGQTYLVAILSGVIVGAFIATIAPTIADIVSLKDGAREAFIGYLRIVAMGVPLSSVLFAGIACLRGAGDSYRPLVAMALCNVVNIIVSFVLAGVPIQTSKLDDAGNLIVNQIVPAVPGFEMGILGIAFGTLIAHAVGAIMITAFLLRGRGGIRLKRRWLKPHRVTLKRLLRLGAPNFAESLGMWVGNLFVVMFVGWLAVADRLAGGTGDGVFGAHIWAIRIEAFSFLPGFSMGMAAATLAGQYLGAGSSPRARTAIIRCTLIGAGIMGLMGAAFILFPHWIIGRFTAQPAHLELVPKLLIICGIVQIPFGIALVIRSALRGAGDVTFVMWITWISTYFMRLPLAYALSGVDIYRTVISPEGEEIKRIFFENPFPHIEGITGTLGGLWLGLCLELFLRGASRKRERAPCTCKGLFDLTNRSELIAVRLNPHHPHHPRSASGPCRPSCDGP